MSGATAGSRRASRRPGARTRGTRAAAADGATIAGGMTTTLLSARGKAGPHDSKTVRVLAFDVAAGADAIGLAFDFGPRVSTNAAANAALLDAAFELHTRRRRAVLPAEEIARH